MTEGRLDELEEMELVNHRLELVRAYDEACAAYDRPRAAVLHAQILAANREIERRRDDDHFKTGLEKASIDELIDMFIQRAIAYDEADGMPEVDDRYWEFDKVSREFERREGDQRRALFKLYLHPDERVHHAAAEATRTLAPVLSVDRMRAVGDGTWKPPESGPGAFEAQMHGLVTGKPEKTKRASSLEDLGVEQLVERFLALSIEQDEAERYDEIARYNRLFSRNHAVIDELRKREGDQRRILARFFDHPNFKVRLNAAHATLAVMPVEARGVFEAIAQSGWQPYSASASGTLQTLDSGFYKPT